MPTPNPTLRREFKGAAAATTLQNSISNTDVSFVLVSANNWPTGSVGKFVVTINRGQADEEKILCDSQTGRTVACLLANRGFDGTTAQSHSAGATVECTISAFDADEWNQHTNATTGVHGAAGAVVGTTDTQVLTNKTLTSPTINSPTVTSPTVTGATLDAASTIGGVSGTTLAADRAAWTSYAPALTNTTGGAGVFFYRLAGKTLFIRGYLNAGTATATAAVTVALPSVTSVAGASQPLAGLNAIWSVTGGSTVATSSSITAGQALTGIGFTGVVEVA